MGACHQDALARSERGGWWETMGRLKGGSGAVAGRFVGVFGASVGRLEGVFGRFARRSTTARQSQSIELLHFRSPTVHFGRQSRIAPPPPPARCLHGRRSG